AEGATKFVEVQVQGGPDSATCLAVAKAIAESPLVKTALSASDANWGRIVMAIGKADGQFAGKVDAGKVDIRIGDVCLMKNGSKHPDYREELGAAAMQPEDIVIAVNLNQGSHTEKVWTSDLSHDYVTINAEYRT
ncbi:MAG: bifunctional ornithine acetyltransferase/N-acetylglutamate synthase, partial [Pseudomonadales bacterium]